MAPLQGSMPVPARSGPSIWGVIDTENKTEVSRYTAEDMSMEAGNQAIFDAYHCANVLNYGSCDNCISDMRQKQRA